MGELTRRMPVVVVVGVGPSVNVDRRWLNAFFPVKREEPTPGQLGRQSYESMKIFIINDANDLILALFSL